MGSDGFTWLWICEASSVLVRGLGHTRTRAPQVRETNKQPKDRTLTVQGVQEPVLEVGPRSLIAGAPQWQILTFLAAVLCH